MIAHDYLFFTALGFRDTTMTNYIGNYALMYAINRHIQVIQRNASGTKPYYQQDLPKVSIYATPASLSSESKIPLARDKILAWENQPKVYITFNSVNTLTQLTENERVNLPQIGRKAKYPPLNSFDFFVIGGNPNGIIRLGKKQVPCRIFATPLKVERLLTGVFQPDHPVNPADLASLLPEDIESAELIRQTPPLLVNARLKATYYVCNDGKNTFHIARPDPSRYPNVPLP
ncbi:MAG: type I-D CRISPR-associated protein Cas5/Csc1 [Nitrososphaerota archaeon]